MSGKRANGEGSISYDRRRKRYRAKITIGWEINEETGRSKQIVKTIGSNYKTKCVLRYLKMRLTCVFLQRYPHHTTANFICQQTFSNIHL